jgi:hypothetical protein
MQGHMNVKYEIVFVTANSTIKELMEKDVNDLYLQVIDTLMFITQQYFDESGNTNTGLDQQGFRFSDMSCRHY